MSYLSIESQFRKIDSQCRWLKVLQHSATFFGIVLVVLLLLEVALVQGWITTPGVATALVALIVAAALLGWIVLMMIVLGHSHERSHLAGRLEKAHPRLLDRLHTLIFLERTRSTSEAAIFYPHIATQASELLRQRPQENAVSVLRPLVHLMVAGLLLATVLWFGQRFTPWQRLMENHRSELASAHPAANAPQPAPEMQLPAPDTSIAEQEKAWGEVRIVDPGRDLRLTKVDVLPLEIEVAASAPLKESAWNSSINGGAEQPHLLPASTEPRYAVYKPEVYLDELQLSEWDVLSYYANTSTEPGTRYASEIYFAEIRPFREDILKLPGGSEGEAYQTLNELTSLIERQQQIVRETHRHIQQPPSDPKLVQQDLSKLTEAETELQQSIEHLYARMATEMENKPIGEALDHLAKASHHAQTAVESLTDHEPHKAQPDEHNALAQLVSARKSFQRSVSENPDQFQDQDAPNPPPIAGQRDQLKSMAEFRDETKAAHEFMQNSIEMEKALADQAERSPTREYPKIARSQDDLRKSLEEFRDQHPRLFKDLEQPTDAARQSMEEAANTLVKKDTSARQQTRQAIEKLQELDQALSEKSSDEQLADAYRLKQMLDQQIETLGQCKSNPSGFSNSDLSQTGQQAKQTVQQLSQVANEMPRAFSQPLREALTPEAIKGINQTLRRLEQAQSDEQKQNAAEQSHRALSEVSQAFEESQPKTLQASRQSDPLHGGSSEGQVGEGLEQLQRLIQQLQKSPGGDSRQKRLGQEALLNLENGLSESEGSNEQTTSLLAQLKEALDPTDRPLDQGQLQQLLEKLRHYTQEVAAPEPEQKEKSDLRAFDPAHLPPAYRAQIEKYFEKLSER